MWEREKWAQDVAGCRCEVKAHDGGWLGAKLNFKFPTAQYRIHPEDVEKYKQACKRVGSYVKRDNWEHYWQIHFLTEKSLKVNFQGKFVHYTLDAGLFDFEMFPNPKDISPYSSPYTPGEGNSEVKSTRKYLNRTINNA